MIRKKLFTFLAFILFFAIGTVFAQEENKRVIPEGMEEIQLGGSAKLIVPKGAKTKQVGAQVIVEGTKEYTARKIFELENELTQMEKKQAELQNDVATLQSTVKNLQDKINLNNPVPVPEASPTTEASSKPGTLIPSGETKGKTNGTN